MQSCRQHLQEDIRRDSVGTGSFVKEEPPGSLLVWAVKTLVLSQIAVSRAPLRVPPSFPKRVLGTIETSQGTLSMGTITVLNEV